MIEDILHAIEIEPDKNRKRILQADPKFFRGGNFRS